MMKNNLTSRVSQGRNNETEEEEEKEEEEYEEEEERYQNCLRCES